MMKFIISIIELSHGGVTEFRAAHRKICEIPFNSTNKFQVSRTAWPRLRGRRTFA